MDVLHKRCAGLDVHKDSVVACVRLADGAKVNREVRTFSTMCVGLGLDADRRANFLIDNGDASMTPGAEAHVAREADPIARDVGAHILPAGLIVRS